MKKTACILLGCGALVAITAGILDGQDRRARKTDKPVEAAAPKRKADEEAIRKASAELTRALEKGDAKALAALWTEEGEYVGGDGTNVRGRAALEAAYTKFFAKNRDVKAETNIDAIRFVGRDSAIEEGFAHVRKGKGKGEEPAASRYSILYAREDGNWRIALLREWPDEGVTLRDLDWLVGTWAAKTEDGEVRTTYEWDENKVFLRARITIKEADRTVTATQTIGKDPRTGGLRSWLFGSDGGFGEAVWSLDGKRWVMEATGVTPDGGEMTATNVLTPIDKDSFSWQSIDRALDGEALPNIAPVKVTRTK
jgi:uncharacterized protein (TIGR02246 family)